MTTQTESEVPLKSTEPEKTPARFMSPFEDFERFFDQLTPRGWLQTNKSEIKIQ